MIMEISMRMISRYNVNKIDVQCPQCLTLFDGQNQNISERPISRERSIRFHTMSEEVEGPTVCPKLFVAFQQPKSAMRPRQVIEMSLTK